MRHTNAQQADAASGWKEKKERKKGDTHEIEADAYETSDSVDGARSAIAVLLLFVDEGVAPSSFTDTSFRWKLKGRSSAEMFFCVLLSLVVTLHATQYNHVLCEAAF